MILGICAWAGASVLAQTAEVDRLEPRERVMAELEAESPRPLRELGIETLPAVFDLLLDGALAPHEQGPVAASYDLLIDGLDSFELAEVVTELQGRISGETPARARRALLEVLERYGRASEIILALDICSPVPPEGREYFARRLEATVESMLRRSPNGMDSLARPLVLAEPDLATALARASVSSGSPFAVDVLAQILEQRPELELPLIGLVASAADQSQRPVSESVCRVVREYLVNDNYQLRREAARASGGLADFESADLLIQMLGAEEEALRSTAHFALRQMSGMAFGPEPARWQLWLTNEVEWFRDQSGEALERVQEIDVPVVLEALDELRVHRYRRFEVARQITPLLEHHSEGVRSRSCAVLQDLAPELPHPAHELCALTTGEADTLAVGDR